MKFKHSRELSENWKIIPLFCLLLLHFLFLEFSYADDGSLVARWNANSEEDLAGYKVYYGTESQNYSTVIDVGNTTTYVAENLQLGQEYFFAVTAYDFSNNESEKSLEASAVVTGPSAIAVRVADGIQVSWSQISDCDSYQIFRSNDPYFTPNQPVATLTDTEFLDEEHFQDDIAASFYIIKAFSGANEIYSFPRIGAYDVSLNKGLNLVSLPLIPADSSLTGVLGTQLTGGTNSSESDQVFVWKEDSYDVMWLAEGTGTEADGKWIDSETRVESTEIFTPEHSFWVQIQSTHSDALVTFTGEVSFEPNTVINLEQGLNFVGGCYPVSIPLDATELYEDNVMIGGFSSSESDIVMHWIGDQYDTAWLVDNTQTDFDGKWMNASGKAVSDIHFQPGVGYILWIKGENPNTVWTYPNPAPIQ